MEVLSLPKSKILSYIVSLTPKVVLESEGLYGVTSLISHHVVDMAIFTFKSFYYFTDENIPLRICDDGTLTNKDIYKIKNHFQNINIIRKSKINSQVLKKCENFKYCNKYRSENLENKFNIKLFDPFLLTNYKRILYLDSDTIFFNKPKRLLNWLRSEDKSCLYATEYKQSLNEDKPVYNEWKIIEKMFIDKFGPNIPPDFNSGLVAIPKYFYSLNKIESVLKYVYRVGLENTWTPEQFSLSFLVSRGKSHNLKEQHIHLTTKVYPFTDRETSDKVSVHFAYLSKPNYLNQAFKLALKTNFFRSTTFRERAIS